MVGTGETAVVREGATKDSPRVTASTSVTMEEGVMTTATIKAAGMLASNRTVPHLHLNTHLKVKATNLLHSTNSTHKTTAVVVVTTVGTGETAVITEEAIKGSHRVTASTSATTLTGTREGASTKEEGASTPTNGIKTGNRNNSSNSSKEEGVMMTATIRAAGMLASNRTVLHLHHNTHLKVKGTNPLRSTSSMLVMWNLCRTLCSPKAEMSSRRRKKR